MYDSIYIIVFLTLLTAICYELLNRGGHLAKLGKSLTSSVEEGARILFKGTEAKKPGGKRHNRKLDSKFWLLFGVSVLLLSLTNPTLRDFRSELKAISPVDDTVNESDFRRVNFFVFSFYKLPKAVPKDNEARIADFIKSLEKSNSFFLKEEGLASAFLDAYRNAVRVDELEQAVSNAYKDSFNGAAITEEVTKEYRSFSVRLLEIENSEELVASETETEIVGFGVLSNVWILNYPLWYYNEQN